MQKNKSPRWCEHLARTYYKKIACGFLMTKKNKPYLLKTRIMKEPISLDTALQIVGSLKVKAIKEIDQVGDPYEKELLSQ